MSGDRKLLVPLAVAALLCLRVAAAESSDFPYLLTDPLRTTPDVIKKGFVLLPGDTAPPPRNVEKDFTKPLSLEETVDLALSNNPKLQSAWADIKIQAGTLGEAYAAYLPVINGGGNWTKDKITYSGNRYPSSNTDRYTYQMTATWRIFDFGGRNANRRSAQNLLAAAISTYDATIQDLLTRVVKAYFDALTASSSLEAKRKDEEIALGTYYSAKEKEGRGVVSQSDTLRAKTALAKATLDKNRAHGDLQKSLAMLGYYIGLPNGTNIVLPSELDERESSDAEREELSMLLDDALKNHPMIQAARKQLEAAREQVTVTKSAGLPTISIGGNYYQNTRPGEAVAPGAKETTFVVGISVPFFDGFTSTYKLRGAQAKLEKQKAALADTEEQITREIIKAHADTLSSLNNLEASSALVESAWNALAVSQRKYDKGAADITEILSTQSALADAWNERVRCLAEWHSSRLQLLASIGRMGRSAVITPFEN